MDVYMKVGIFHIKSCKAGATGKAWEDNRECDHMKMEVTNEFVQRAEIQDGAEATPFLWYEEIGGVKGLISFITEEFLIVEWEALKCGLDLLWESTGL